MRPASSPSHCPHLARGHAAPPLPSPCRVAGAEPTTQLPSAPSPQVCDSEAHAAPPDLALRHRTQACDALLVRTPAAVLADLRCRLVREQSGASRSMVSPGEGTERRGEEETHKCPREVIPSTLLEMNGSSCTGLYAGLPE